MTVRFGRCVGLAAVGLALVGGAACAVHGGGGDVKAEQAGWTIPQLPAKTKLAATGRNPYFVLEPGYQMVLRKKGGTDTLTVTVTRDTKIVDGVETRVVEERETENGGQLAEVSRNYFAIDTESGDLFYFGEETDTYKGGKVTGHEGSWLAGEGGAKAGIMVPGKPAVGMKYYEEQAPGKAMDRSEVVSVSETMKTPAGQFRDCLKLAETTPLEKGEHETKWYAPGVGLLLDEDFELVSYGMK